MFRILDIKATESLKSWEKNNGLYLHIQQEVS